MEKTVHIGLLGFGTVGTGVVRILKDNAGLIEQKTGAKIVIKSILVRDLKKARNIESDAKLTTEAAEILNDPGNQYCGGAHGR